jgi:1-pyrroline-5-carboxylate dehydrogenase
MHSESYPSNTAPRLFKPGSTEVNEISAEINNLSACTHELAMVIGGKKIIGGGKRIAMPMPHHKSQNYAFVTLPSKNQIEQAVENSLSASREWAETSIEHRAAIFSKVADLIEFKYRDR